MKFSYLLGFFCIISCFMSCKKYEYVDSDIITENRKETYDTFLYTIDTVSNIVHISFHGNEVITMSKGVLNNFSITGNDEFVSIELGDSNKGKYLLAVDTSALPVELFFDEDDFIIDEKPCCSRNNFKAWYKLFKENCTGTPECDLICNIANGACEISHYLSAAFACCYYGTGPSGIPVDGIKMEYSITI